MRLARVRDWKIFLHFLMAYVVWPSEASCAAHTTPEISGGMEAYQDVVTQGEGKLVLDAGQLTVSARAEIVHNPEFAGQLKRFSKDVPRLVDLFMLVLLRGNHRLKRCHDLGATT